MCRCLTLSDRYLACGFADGAVRLFNLATRLHAATFRPQYRDRLGQFSRAVSGIIISSDDTRLVFATLDGDIHVADIVNAAAPPRRAHSGDVYEDGVLVDFTGCDRYWVGLYAGLAGRAFQIRDSQTEAVTFRGGSLTDQNTVMGWRMVTELTELVGRIRVTDDSALGLACTSSRAMVFDLRNQGVVLSEEEHERGIVVGTVDVGGEWYMMVDGRGWARVRRVETGEEVCRFNARQRNVEGMMGCMNLMCGLIRVGGMIRVWEVERGNYLYRFRERVGEVNAFVADDTHVAASSGSRIHLWDFGVGEVEEEEEQHEDGGGGGSGA